MFSEPTAMMQVVSGAFERDLASAGNHKRR